MIARFISIGSCKSGHVHVRLLDEREAVIASATLSHRDWLLFTGVGHPTFASKGIAPVVNTFELEAAPCADITR
jgi:hypothetical protein